MAVNTLPSPKEALAALDERDDREYSDAERDEMMELYEDTFETIEQGEIVTGTVLSIHDNAVLIDIGFKSEGVITPPLLFLQLNLPVNAPYGLMSLTDSNAKPEFREEVLHVKPNSALKLMT